MCGIVGYVGPRDVRSTLIAGLRHLEYRGYDSAGLVVAAASGGLHAIKRAGRLANLEAAVGESAADAGIAGMAHTRWATHGGPTDDNAHPHLDEAGAIAVIHNGIIENFAELKEGLVRRGHRFSSSTDTEVVAHLVEEAYGGDLREAVAAVLPLLRGQWALVAMHAAEPGRIVAARREAPLAVGLGEGEAFVVSDPVAILEHTGRVVFLRDGDLVDLAADSVRFFDAAGTSVAPQAVELSWDRSAAEKGGYAHFMRKEMDEQPQALRAALIGRASTEGIGVSELEPLTAALATLRSIEFVACGSAYHAAMTAAGLAERLLGIPVRATVASEFRYAPPTLDGRSLVIAVSQSGETADTLGAVRLARRAGAPVLAIVNAAGSSLTREADATVLLQAGPEVSVAATKSYTSQALVALLVVLDLARRTGRLQPGELRDWAGEILALPDAAQRALGYADQLPAIAADLFGSRGFMFISRGAGLASALEGALKLKEISYIHADAYPAGELKHGPISLLGPDHPVVAVVLEGAVRAKLESNISEARARSAPVLAIATEGLDAAALGDSVIWIPAAREEVAAILAAIPLQRFAYEMALLAGADIDQPKNLAKSVTVE